MPIDLTRKKTIPMEGAPGGNPNYKPTLKKNVVKKKVVKKKVVVKKNNSKNKNIVDTKIKNIPTSLKKKVNQKVKNIKNSTPTELIKKSKKFINNYSPISYVNRKIHKKVNSLIKNRRK